MAAYPLFGSVDSEALIAWREQRAITLGTLMGDAQRVAEGLPMRAFQVNLCRDRYRFLVALVAAQLHHQTLLMPPGRAPADLAYLRKLYPSLYCLTDSDTDHGDRELYRFSDPLEGVPGEPLFPEISADRVVVELYTSGSTGTATAHPKTWGMLYRGAGLTGARLGLDRLAGASVVATVPPQHMYGLETSIVLPLRWGLAVAAEQPLFAADIAAALERLPPPRILITTPLHLRNCILASAELPPVELILSATAPLHQPLAEQVEQRFDTRVLEIYGSTETGAVATRRPACDSVWEMLPGVSIAQREQRWWLSAGHLPDPVPLNDRLRLQSASRFSLLGRDADLIKIAGNRTSLADLNHKLLAIEGIRDGVFFLPETAPGAATRLACFAVAPGIGERRIMDALRQTLDPAFLPRPLFRVPALPRNETGKLPRQALLDLFEQCSRGCGPQEKVACSSIMRIPSDHPSLSGHFPGNPIVPGVVILDKVIRVAQQRDNRVTGVAWAKFKAPLLPETTFRVELSPCDDGLDFRVVTDDQSVACGALSCVQETPPEQK